MSINYRSKVQFCKRKIIDHRYIPIVSLYSLVVGQNQTLFGKLNENAGISEISLNFFNSAFSLNVLCTKYKLNVIIMFFCSVATKYFFCFRAGLFAIRVYTTHSMWSVTRVFQYLKYLYQKF